jgi:acyl carrier protein/NAD(P)-dependent dehydrogenase (short-subunit alcohol dehydrogenase family)
MQEHPELACTLVDIEAGSIGLEQVLRELGNQDDEQQIAWRGGERRVARLVRAPAAGKGQARELRTDGTVLVTGGLGDLGLLVTRSLAKRGVKHLVLTGRRGLETPGAREAVSELEGLGSKVTVASVDVADGEGLAKVLHGIPVEFLLRGVVHAAGVLDDGVLATQTQERMARVLSPKVAGACYLDALTRQADLDMFVLFSSASGTLGSAGQGPYAAANTFLDGLAARRQQEGLAGQSLAWGLWMSDTDMGAGLASKLNAAQRARATGGGVAAITAPEGIALFEASVERSDAQLVPLPIDVAALRQRLGGDVPPLFRGLIQAVHRGAKGKRGAWARELAALSPEERAKAVLEAVRAEVARTLSLSSADAAPADRPLKELGLDSLMAVDLRKALGKRAGVTLPATLAFDYPTPAAIARYLLERALGFVSVNPSEVSSAAVVSASNALTIADVVELSDQELLERLNRELANPVIVP